MSDTALVEVERVQRPVSARFAEGGTELLRRFRPALPAVALYYLVQGIAVLMFVWWVQAADLDVIEQITRWDGQWFMRIATDGYDTFIRVDERGSPHQSPLAFLPGYPAAIAALTAVTGMSPTAAGLTVTAIAGGFAAAGIYFVGEHLWGNKVGIALSTLWAMAPGSVVLHMVYSEALFVALTAWTLVSVLRRNWLAAATFGFLAGLTRNTAFALVAAVSIAALIAIVRKQDGWRPWVALAFAPLGLGCYLGLVGWYAGRVDGWFWLQSKAWGLRFDAGAFTFEHVWKGLRNYQDTVLTMAALIIIGGLILLLWSFTESRTPVFLHVYAVVVMALALCSSEFWASKGRFMLPAFVILIPLARLAAQIPNRAVVLLVPIVAAGAGWHGVSLLVTGVTP